MSKKPAPSPLQQRPKPRLFALLMAPVDDTPAASTTPVASPTISTSPSAITK